MTDGRFILLVEKFLENELSPAEETELNNILFENPSLKAELEEQIKVKEVMRRMMMKNPSAEVWDRYHAKSFNRNERKLGWTIFIAGILILLFYWFAGIVEVYFYSDNVPLPLKIGIALLLGGGAFLVISVIREKIFTSKYDKYKEIER